MDISFEQSDKGESSDCKFASDEEILINTSSVFKPSGWQSDIEQHDDDLFAKISLEYVFIFAIPPKTLMLTLQ